MKTQFSGPDPGKPIRVQVDGIIYSGDEIIAFFDDILKTITEQPRGLKNKSQFLNMIRILLGKKEYRKASVVIYRALSRYRGDPAIIKLQVEEYLALKENDTARKIVDQYLDENPADISFYLQKAKIERKAGDFREEERILLKLVGTSRYDFKSNRIKQMAYHRLAEIYLKTDRFEQAEAMLEYLLRSDNEQDVWSMYFATLHKTGKRESLQKAKDDFARYMRAKVYFNKGFDYEKDYKYSLALKHYREGLEIFPDDALINVQVGNILMKHKKWYSKAELYFKKAIEIDPDQEIYVSKLILCLKRQGKYKEAYETAIKATNMEPGSNIYLLRSLASKLDREEEVIGILTSAAENDIHGEHPHLRYVLGMLHEAVNGFEEAEEWYQKALISYIKKAKNFPEDWGLYIDLGNCYSKLKNYREAEKFYKIAEKMKGCDLEELYDHMVDIYQKSNRRNKAQAYLKKLIGLNPAKLINYIDLGINYVSGMTSRARRKQDIKKREEPKFLNRKNEGLRE
ncbi:MAG: hypothetical protein K8T10_12940 [Candidatus Eremiobacteraeota bacterium]|nr:hypothetical protein [Candidatus Eremiobacteraeota bacterium]